jgi:hypothetical protein
MGISHRRGGLVRGLNVFLTLSWWGSAVLLAVSLCFLLITPWVDPPHIEIGLAVPVAFAVNGDVHAIDGSAFHAYFKNAGGSLYFSPFGKADAASGTAALVLVIAFALFVIGQLRAVFRTLDAGRPFVAANVTRLRRIGWSFIAGAIAWAAIAYAGSVYATSHFAADAVRLDRLVDVNGAAVLAGAIILAIAEVFREGTRLEEDQSLTV